MRRLVSVLGLVVVAALPVQAQPVPQRAAAQRPHEGPRATPVQQQRAPAPPQPANPPQTVAPPIVYPFPPLMAPPAGGLTSQRTGESPRFQTFAPLFFPYGSSVYAPYVTDYRRWKKRGAERIPPPAPPAMGLLRFAVTPGTAQVFVDSYYVGTVDDINAQNVLTLEAGPHRIEIRAPQYRTITVDVRILPYETVTYRAALEPIPLAPPAPRAPAVAGPPTPMYVIPNCYLGNVPPRPARLPSGCDINKVQLVGPK